jgi:hypothetical protein
MTLVLLSRGIVANALSPQAIAKNSFNSTVLLVMEDANGQPIGLGSGFFVQFNQIATNLHVVEGAAGGYAKLVGKKSKFEINGISAIDAKRDLVILQVATSHRQLVSIAGSDTVQVGDRVYAIGNPRGLEGTFSQGIISSVRKIGTDRLLQITAPVSPGSSGGPVLNENGKVIGVSVATFQNGQNLNFAIPSNYLAALLTRVGPVKPFSVTQRKKSQRSVLDGLGGKSTEAVSVVKIRQANNYEWHYFSIRNRLRQDVKNVRYRLILYDILGDPIDAKDMIFNDVIPAGLAKRTSGRVDASGFSRNEITVKFIILDYEIVEN